MLAIKGSIPALVTPFREGHVDVEALERLVEWHIAEGSDALVAVGTTGESPTVSKDEHKDVIKRVVDLVGGRVPVIAGTGSNATAQSLDMLLHAERVGADAALIVTPYYNKPNQAGLLSHYQVLHDSSAIPIILYNIPGRCVIDILPETMAQHLRYRECGTSALRRVPESLACRRPGACPRLPGQTPAASFGPFPGAARGLRQIRLVAARPVLGGCAPASDTCHEGHQARARRGDGIRRTDLTVKVSRLGGAI
jgi:uncharacterized protein YbjQ (UPF0145 family)